MRVPAEVASDQPMAAATGVCFLCLEFWRGVVYLGTYKLPLSKIKQALANQVWK